MLFRSPFLQHLYHGCRQEGLVRDLSAVANEQMLQEKEQYESALEQEAKEEKQNGTTKEKQ